MSAREVHAYLDESLSNAKIDPNAYVLAASLCRRADLDGVREEVARLRLRGQHKLHWRDESARRRREITVAIAVLPVRHVVVVRTGLSGERSERRRRLCLQPMLIALEATGVGAATFESRGAADDRRDRDLVSTMRAREAISADLRVHHERGPREPLLWLPDAVCGAVTAHRSGSSQYLELITAGTEVQIIDVAA